LTAFPDFTLDLAGGGAALDPAAGTLTLSGAALAQGLGFTLMARDAEGAPTAAFRVTLTLRDAAEPTVAPALVGAPALLGAGLVGQPITLDPGIWSGVPAPELEYIWLRDGVEIPGATDPVYLPGVAEDGALLGARVTARNSAGLASAETATLRVTEIAPSAIGALADLALVQGAGRHRVEAGAAFAGAGLAFEVAGPGEGDGGPGEGAVIDPVTGALDIPLDRLREAEIVTVTARNSGGAAVVRFAVTVRAGVSTAPPEVTGTPSDLAYPLGAGAASVSTQAYFTGADLAYALETAPEGVSILPGSGLVSIPTGAPLDGVVTVRAENAGGAARLSFRVAVRAMTTVFSEEATLPEMRFLATGAAPAWTFDPAQGFARLVPATTGRTHGLWSKAGGDGRYRMLARWSALNSTAGENEPFVFGARLGQAGGNFTGVFLEAFRPGGTSAKRLRILEYTGRGIETVERAAAVSNWVWGTWYWVEVEIAGSRIRARYHAETAEAPDWMIEAETTVPQGAGGFGPGAFPLAGVSPTLLLKRIEFTPIEAEIPAAAQAGDWSLAQVTR
jgi:hypothetical protein